MLVINNLSVAIDHKTIIHNFSITLNPGTVHTLMGPNGSGKSSLAATIMGHPLYTIRQGTIQFKNQSVPAMPVHQRAKLGIFLAFQQPIDIPGVHILTFLKEAYTALKGAPASDAQFMAQVENALAIVGLESACVYRTLNEGFSGGEKKKLELLQMLVLNPDLVILDEIDSGLDIDALNMVGVAIAELKRMNPTVTVLLITHNPRIVHTIKPDYVHVMRHGTIAHSGGCDLAYQLEKQGYHGTIGH